jgi:multidrug resistance protein, MATE family
MALPLMISTFSYSLMQFCDRAFLTWHSMTSVAAVLPAGVISWALLAFPFGVAMYTNVFVAQYFGAGRPERIGSVIWHGLVLGLILAPLFLAIAIWPEFTFRLAGHDEALVTDEAAYLRWMAPGSIAQIFGAVLSGLFIGLGRTRTVMFVDIGAALLNILFDWLLIFGFSVDGLLTVSPMGIQGAAIATSLALWCKLGILIFLVYRSGLRQRCQIFETFQIRWEMLWRMVRFGSGNGWQMLVECLAMAAFSMMVGKLGTVVGAANTLALSVNMLVFVPIWGLSTVVSTLVGQRIGEGRPDLAERATWTAMAIGLAYTLVFAVLYLVFPDAFLSGYRMEEGAKEIHELARTLLIFVALFCLFDTVQIVFAGAIKGAGDTAYVIVASIICSAAFVGIGVIGQKLFESGVGQLYWWWWAITAWILFLGIAYGGRFFQGEWKKKSVIESNLIPHPVVEIED